MKILTYANTELLTGNEIALAVLHYSAALAEAGLAETIEIPVIEANGSQRTAFLLVGPASQIVARDAETDGPELIDVPVVAALNTLIQQLRPVVHTDAEAPAHTEWVDEL